MDAKRSGAIVVLIVRSRGSRPLRAAAPIALGLALASGALPATSGAAHGQEQAADWPPATFEAAGLAPEPFGRLDERIRAGSFGFVDRVVVARHGALVVDARYENDYEEISRGRRSPIGCGFACPDSAWDHQFNYLHPDWHPYYQGRDVHTLQSVTKSISATLIGVAVQRGAIPSVDEEILPYLADYDVSDADERLRRVTIDDVLTMRSGIEWHESDRPMDSTNTTIRLELSDDWVRFTLDQPMDADPGTKWAYNSGGSHLMSAILRGATGMTMDRYAERYLFGPLGIEDHHWKITRAGLPDALGGLYLEAADLARIGQLYLQDGVWEGERILPDGWVAAATARRVGSVNGAGDGYGYQWWRPDREGVEVWAGQGFGGQYLLILPEYDVVAVIQSWNLLAGRVESLRNALIGAIVEAAEGDGRG